MKWPPKFERQPFYFLEQPYALIEMDELFEGNKVRDEFLHVGLCVVRENNKNPTEVKYPAIHKKAWGVRYSFPCGIADHVLPNSAYGIARMVLVDGDPMKKLILELVRELAIFNPPLGRYID
jgi:hypothetical protein